MRSEDVFDKHDWINQVAKNQHEHSPAVNYDFGSYIALRYGTYLTSAGMSISIIWDRTLWHRNLCMLNRMLISQ